MSPFFKFLAASPLLWVSSCLHPFLGHCEQKAMPDEGVIYVTGHPLLNRRCTRLPECVCLQNDLYCVGWGVKLCSLTRYTILFHFTKCDWYKSRSHAYWRLCWTLILLAGDYSGRSRQTRKSVRPIHVQFSLQPQQRFVVVRLFISCTATRFLLWNSSEFCIGIYLATVVSPIAWLPLFWKGLGVQSPGRVVMFVLLE